MKKREIEKLEEYVEALLNKEITREKLAENLHIDLRYLSAMISELNEINPELYARYINKYPYKPKEITHIDYEAVVIEMLKNRMNMREIAEKYQAIGVTEKTLRRRINEFKITNPNLYYLYKKLALLNRGNLKLTEKEAIEFDSAIDKLESKPVLLGNSTDTREKEIEELEKKFLQLREQGLSTEDAAKQMGTTFPILYKKFADLDRIRTEKSFREGLKVDKQPVIGEERAEENKKEQLELENDVDELEQ